MIAIERKKLEQVLEALENHCGNYKLDDEGVKRFVAACKDIKEALAQPEQKPVLWGVRFNDGKFSPYAYWLKKDAERIAANSHLGTVAAALYTTPPKRPWVELTDEEASWCQAPSTIQTWKRIEAKLKEKNT